MNRFSTCAWIETSSAAVDSSQTSTCGLHRERPGDADAGALPARELVRIAPPARRIEPDPPHHLADIGVHAGGGHDAVHDRRLADDLDDAPARVERRHRVLEDHLHGKLRRPALGAGQRLARRGP